MTGPCEGCDGPPYACANCRRPLEWWPGVGWLHAELPQYAHEPAGCAAAEPVHLRHGSRHRGRTEYDG